jgi:hypothetical protein
VSVSCIFWVSFQCSWLLPTFLFFLLFKLCTNAQIKSNQISWKGNAASGSRQKTLDNAQLQQHNLFQRVIVFPVLLVQHRRIFRGQLLCLLNRQFFSRVLQFSVPFLHHLMRLQVLDGQQARDDVGKFVLTGRALAEKIVILELFATIVLAFKVEAVTAKT